MDVQRLQAGVQGDVEQDYVEWIRQAANLVALLFAANIGAGMEGSVPQVMAGRLWSGGGGV
jgi:hypothetical protein